MATETQEFALELVEPDSAPIAAIADPSDPYAGLTGIDRIGKMIEDPDFPVAEISRLIALEIVAIMRRMAPENVLDRGATSQRDLNDHVKAYRELQRTLTESDALSKKDTLNLDGEKFKFAFQAIMGFFQKSLKDCGIQDDQARNIMLHFGDQVRANESALRTDLNKIGTGR